MDSASVILSAAGALGIVGFSVNAFICGVSAQYDEQAEKDEKATKASKRNIDDDIVDAPAPRRTAKVEAPSTTVAARVPGGYGTPRQETLFPELPRLHSDYEVDETELAFAVPDEFNLREFSRRDD